MWDLSFQKDWAATLLCQLYTNKRHIRRPAGLGAWEFQLLFPVPGFLKRICSIIVLLLLLGGLGLQGHEHRCPLTSLGPFLTIEKTNSWGQHCDEIGPRARFGIMSCTIFRSSSGLVLWFVFVPVQTRTSFFQGSNGFNPDSVWLEIPR